MGRHQRQGSNVSATHGPPPLRSSKWPNGLPGVQGVNLLRLRAANELYRYMSELILKLDAAGVTWTVENPWTSLMWATTYGVDVDTHLKPCCGELHNCKFGDARLKRTCLASNNRAVMALDIVCNGDHEHAPWGVHDGIFDTAREAAYTPQLAKVLATTVFGISEGQMKLQNVAQVSKKPKLSHFHSIAASKQPSKLTALPSVPEFSHILMLKNVPFEVQFSFWMVRYNFAPLFSWMAIL